MTSSSQYKLPKVPIVVLLSMMVLFLLTKFNVLSYLGELYGQEIKPFFPTTEVTFALTFWAIAVFVISIILVLISRTSYRKARRIFDHLPDNLQQQTSIGEIAFFVGFYQKWLDSLPESGQRPPAIADEAVIRFKSYIERSKYNRPVFPLTPKSWRDYFTMLVYRDTYIFGYFIEKIFLKRPLIDFARSNRWDLYQKLIRAVIEYQFQYKTKS